MKVSWEDAQGYVQWLSQETGARYRLLTEAEWEYVARAGTQTARYWGMRESGQCRYGNGADAAARREFPDVDASNFTGCSDGYVYNAPVGSFQPNAFGLYDMLGNVWEWTEDCWNGDYSGAPRTEAPGGRVIVPSVCCAAAPGAPCRGASVRRSASGPRPGSGTGTSDSVSPEP